METAKPILQPSSTTCSDSTSTNARKQSSISLKNMTSPLSKSQLNSAPTSLMLMIPQEEWQSLHEKLDRLIEIVEKTQTGSPAKTGLSPTKSAKSSAYPQDVAELPRPTPHPLLADRPQNLRQPHRPRRLPPKTPYPRHKIATFSTAIGCVLRHNRLPSQKFFVTLYK